MNARRCTSGLSSSSSSLLSADELTARSIGARGAECDNLRRFVVKSKGFLDREGFDRCVLVSSVAMGICLWGGDREREWIGENGHTRDTRKMDKEQEPRP